MTDDKFEVINDARKLLGLAEITTIDNIKKAYKDKIKKYHPDRNSENTEAHWRTIEIMKAYEILIKYCQNYKFSFKKEDYLDQNPLTFDNHSDSDYMDWWQNHYGDDPPWGRGNRNE